MQLNQSPLGNNIRPLGVISYLSHPHISLLRKESYSLHSRSNFISPIQTKPPLATSSKFFLSRENEPSIQPLIGWDSWEDRDINSDFSLLESDSFDSIALPENNNINSSDSVKNSIPEILPNSIDNNTSNNISTKLNIKGKSKSKKPNKSQQPQEKKSKPRTKKAVKSSVAKNDNQFVDESDITINRNEDSLLASDEPLSIEASEPPTLQLETGSENTTNDNNVRNLMPGITASASPILEDNSTLLRDITNDALQLNPEVQSSFTSAESSVTESIMSSEGKIELDKNKSGSVEDSPREFPLYNAEEIFTPSSNFTNKVIPEASEVLNIPDIPVSPTPSKQDIETSQAASIVDNKTTASQTNLIQAKEVSPSLTSPLQEKESPHTNSNHEAITAIEPSLISESIVNNFVRDNTVVDNSLTLSSALTSSDVNDAPTLLHPLANDENTVGADTYAPAPLPDVTTPNSESSVAKSPIAIQQKIDSSISSEFPASAPVQLTPTSADITATSPEIGETPTITGTSPEIGETAIAPLTTTSSEIAETPTITTTSPEIGETAIAPLRATLPEIGETPKITATSPEIGETAIAPLMATSSEIVETPTITATSPEIGETAIAPLTTTSSEIAETPTITTTSPEIGETAIAPLRATLPEIGETPKITATSPEIGETAIAPLRAASPEIAEIAIKPKITATSPENGETAIAPLTATSPEIVETPIITATSSEIGETAIAPLIATSPEISEAPKITAKSPEIGETAIAPLIATSPEIVETPTITGTSSEIGETAIAPLTATSPEIVETPIITAKSPETAIAPLMATSSEIVETPTITATSPEIGETAIAPLTATSSEIVETPTITATSPEIGETAIAPLRTTLPEIGETPTITGTSPEIGETAIAPKISATSSEIAETPTITATSPEIAETPKISATSSEIAETAIAPLRTTLPEIGETPTITATSPEIGETAIAPVSAASPEIGETASIFRKTIDNEQTVESEFTFAVTNPEISTFVDTPDNPTSPQDEVSTPPEVEQNSLQTLNFKESEEKTSPETPTKVDSFPDTSLQLKSAETHSPQISNSLIPSSLGLDIGKQKLSILNSPQLNPLQNETIYVGEPSPQYSSPPLIFRKANPNTTNTPSQSSNTPSQWSSVEDLLNGNNDEFTSFNFNDVESNSQNYEFSHVSESPQIFAKHLPAPRGFAEDRKVTPTDISRDIEPVTQKIENTYLSSKLDAKDDTADLEALAREIYSRLRQRIEIERERHGGHSGRLPW
ncbi:MAG: hypothetical protein V7L01_08155 [Nostoc sp.]|uniref:hypothetical protein n=1 Tax=Nostoc sp. TaxID=1180 RepID=UPI002FF739AE